jgi:hypothetical protein
VSPDSTGPDEAALAEVREAWLEVSDDLLQGVGHALNNRVAALAAVGQVLAATTEGPLTRALSAESSRLQRAVQLLRLLVRRWDAEAEPLTVQEVLDDVAELVSHHPRVRDVGLRVEAEAGLLPVRAERSSLTHAFCLLLAPAAEAAERGGEESVPVRCTGTEREVLVEVPFPSPSPSAEGDLESGHDRPPGAGVDPRSARGLVQRAGGELSVREEAGKPVALLVRLPTLVEARRRERERGG